MWFTAQRQKYAAESKYEKLGLSVYHFLYESVNEFCKCLNQLKQIRGSESS